MPQNKVSNQEEMLIPRHLGIIMDGNGRWAQKRGLPRSAGHLAAMQRVRRTVEDCAKLGVRVLTLYTFSTENWNRPQPEVNYLMLLAQEYANHELPELQRNNIRLQLMGRRDELPDAVLRALDNTIQQTQTNTRMVLNIALNYGGRTEIVDATKAILSDYQVGRISPEEINEDTLTSYMYCPQCPDVDLIIRTGGEWRLSNFLLWRASRAIFVTQSILWPDFKKKDLLAAVKVYQEQSLRRGQSG